MAPMFGFEWPAAGEVVGGGVPPVMLGIEPVGPGPAVESGTPASAFQT
jgi:hypothetical protein